MSKSDDIRWVAHRGYAEEYPENTLKGIIAALTCGAHAVEFDVQITKDLVPVVLHDENLKRTAQCDLTVSNTTLSDLTDISVHEPQRFNEQFNPTPLSTLLEVAAYARQWPDRLFFVEIKKEVFKQISRQRFFDLIAPILLPIQKHCVIISYDETWTALVKDQGWHHGWVLTKYDDTAHAVLREHEFEFAICNIQKILKLGGPLWQGKWEWFVYDVLDLPTLQACKALGIQWIETWDVKRMMTLI